MNGNSMLVPEDLENMDLFRMPLDGNSSSFLREGLCV